jgi:hypothetical protein
MKFSFVSLLLYKFTVNFTGAACGICLVGIQVNCGCEVGTNSYNNVVECKSSGIVVNLYLNNLAVGNAPILCNLRGEVRMALCDDNAFFNVKLSGRADNLDSGAAFNIAGFSYGAVTPSVRASVMEISTCVAFLAGRVLIRSLWYFRAYEVNSFTACELSGL